jgi:ABC-type dipeptide/oligopeptide/nickel transport system permease component
MLILARRLTLAVPTLLLLSLTVFLLLSLAPGDAALTVLDDTATVEQQTQLRETLGLDQPVMSQYFTYLGRVLSGDMGRSIRTDRPVLDEVILRLPYTVVLVTAGTLLGITVGIGLGLLSAHVAHSHWDTIITAGVSVTTALPVFWIALLLVEVFSLRLGMLPVFGADSPAHLVLPAAATSLLLVPGIARLTRASLLETRSASFVLFARSKGLSGAAVARRHIGPVAAISILTYVSLQMVSLISSVAIIERIFNWPGLGGLVIIAALDRDTPLLLGTTMAIGILVFAILFFFDLLLLYLDPRISRQAV